MEKGLYVYLKNHSGLAALISDRVYPTSEVPQGVTLPAVGYERISTPAMHSMDGASLFSPRMQITVLASSTASADGVADQVKNALNAFSGPFTDGTIVQFSRLLDHRGPFRDDETKSVVAELDFEIWHL
jgi:hypothetical protein